DNRISRTESHQLHNGDVVFIDAYQIKVTIAKDPEAAERDDPFAQLQARGKGGTKQIPPPRPPAANEADRTENMVKRPPRVGSGEEHSEGTVWFGLSDMSSGSQPASPGLRAKAEPARPAPVANNRPPPSRRSPPAASPVRAVPSAAERSAQSPDTAQLKALLDAAGIEGLDPSSEAAQTLGAMLRAAVGGMMEVLRSRERMKDEL